MGFVEGGGRVTSLTQDNGAQDTSARGKGQIGQ